MVSDALFEDAGIQKGLFVFLICYKRERERERERERQRQRQRQRQRLRQERVWK